MASFPTKPPKCYQERSNKRRTRNKSKLDLGFSFDI